MAEIAELIERMERASGPDDLRNLERPFLEACFGVEPTCNTGDGGGDEWHCGAWSSDPHPFYSIDAALSLVPENCAAKFQAMWEGQLGAHAFLMGPSHKFASDFKIKSEGHVGWPNCHSYADAHRLFPLALCVAALRLRSHSVGE